jgi:hypothetical protein
MNKIAKLLFFFSIGMLVVSCNPSDGPSAAPLRDFQDQYDRDLADITQFLQTHSYSVVDHPGFSDDQDVTFAEIPDTDTTTPSIWESPLLLSRDYHDAAQDVTYKIYYLKLREGGGADIANLKPKPSNVDAVLAAYKGSYIFHHLVDTTVNGVTTTVDSLKTNEFESTPFPQTALSLEAGNVIRGWSEVFPQFRPGDFTPVNGEPTVYTDFGAGVMFLPSGVGYFNAPPTAIPAYSPLIFTFKLYEMTRLDQDQDGVFSWLEDRDQDGYIYILPEGTINPDDTDSDLAPDYLDLDDDGDHILTKNEVTLDDDGNVIFEDCDGDGKPNYLDSDRDNDGILDGDDDNNVCI